MKRALSAILAVLFLVNSIFADISFSADSMNIQPFTGQMDTANDHASVLKAYLIYQLMPLRSSGIPSGGLSIERNFPAAQRFNKRIEINSLENITPNSWALICDVGGYIFRATIDLSGFEVVDIRLISHTGVRRMPVGSDDTFDITAILGEAPSVFDRIRSNPEYEVTSDELDDMSKNLLKVLKAGFNRGLFNDLTDVVNFIRPQSKEGEDQGIDIGDLPRKSWLNFRYYSLMGEMLTRIASSDADAALPLAEYCSVFGKAFYNLRTPTSYSVSSFFYETACKLEPDNNDYKEQLAQTLKHCGLYADAKKIMESLPTTNRLSVKLGYIDIKAAETGLKALERLNIHTIREGDFKSQVSATELILNGIIDRTKDRGMSTYPLGMSLIGRAHGLSARLNNVKLRYAIQVGSDRPHDVELLCARVIVEISNSISCSRSALDKAKTPGEKAHAAGMLRDVVDEDGKAMRAWQKMVTSNAMIFPRHLLKLSSSLKKLWGDPNKRSGVSGLGDLRATFGDTWLPIANDWIHMHEFIIARTRDIIKNCGEEDLIDPELFIGRVKKDIITGLQADVTFSAFHDQYERLADKYVDQLAVSLPVDKMALETLVTYHNLVGNPERTSVDEIKSCRNEYFQIAPDPEADAEARTDARILRIAKTFGFRVKLSDGVNVSEEQDQSGVGRIIISDDADETADIRAPRITTSGPNNDDLARSIHFKNKGKPEEAFKARWEDLKSNAERLLLWDGQLGIKPQYVGSVYAKIMAAEQSINSYIPMTEAILSAKSPSMADKTNVSVTYESNRRRLVELETLMEKRYKALERAIGGVILDLIPRIRKLEMIFSGVDVEWVANDLIILKSGLNSLQTISDPKDKENRLSFEMFTDTVMDLDMKIREMEELGVRVSTFRPVFDIIARAENEVAISEAFWGRKPVFRSFGQKLADLRVEIFSSAYYDNLDYSGITEDQNRYYKEISDRVEYMKRLRGFSKIIDGSINDLAMGNKAQGIISVVETLRKDIAGMLHSDVFDSENMMNIFDEICNLSTACPGPELVEDICVRMKFKARYALITRTSPLIKGQFSRFEERIDWMNKICPGLVSAEKKRHFSEFSDQIEDQIIHVNELNLYDRDFEQKVLIIRSSLKRIENDFKGEKKLLNIAWCARIADELVDFKKVIMLWGKEWVKLDEETLGDIEKCFDDMIGDLKNFDLGGKDLQGFKDKMRGHSETFLGIMNSSRLGGRLPKILKESIGPYIKNHAHSDYWRKRLRKLGFADGDDTSNIFYPVYGNDGTLVDAVLGVVHMKEKGCILYRERLIADPVTIGSHMGEADKKELAEQMNIQFNRLFAPDGKNHDMGINFLHFSAIAGIMMGFYRNLSENVAGDTIQGTNKLEINGIDVRNIFNDILVGYEISQNEHCSKGSQKDVALSLKAEIGLLEAKIRHAGSEATDDDIMMLAQLREAYRGIVFLPAMGWFSEDTSRIMRSSVNGLIDLATGKKIEPSSARPAEGQGNSAVGTMMTFSQNTTVYLQTHPPMHEYRGVYYDPGNMAFDSMPSNVSPESFRMMRTLNEALSSYMAALSPGRDEAKEDEPWRERFDNIINSIKNEGSVIHIAVTRNLGTNSLVVIDDKTIVFDADFIEAIMDDGSDKVYKGASYLVLGERIMHELGHLAIEKDFDRSPSEYDKTVDSEVNQLWNDVLFYRQIYHNNPQRTYDVFRYVNDRLVQGKKFSTFFKTSYLFKNIQRWANESDPNRVRQDIRLFVINALKNLRWADSIRTMPAVPADGLSIMDTDLSDVGEIEASITEALLDQDYYAKISRLLALSRSMEKILMETSDPSQIVRIYILLEKLNRGIGNQALADINKKRAEITAGFIEKHRVAGSFDRPKAEASIASTLRAKGLRDSNVEKLKTISDTDDASLVRWYAEVTCPFEQDNVSLPLACLVNSSRDLLNLDLSVLRNMENVNSGLLGKDRRIIISDKLIPESQGSLKNEINRMSRDAYDSGRTKELITICSAEDAQAVASDDNTEVVVLLENEELSGYKGKELCLAFKRSGDDPILINGVIAAGRALLYRNMPRLLDILRELSGDEKLSELTAADMEKLLTDDRYSFTRRLIITLPALVRFDIQEIAILNRAILEAVRAA